MEIIAVLLVLPEPNRRPFYVAVAD